MRGLAVVLTPVVALLTGCGPDVDDYPPVRMERINPPMDAGPPDAGRMDTGPPPIPDEPLEDWDTTGAGPLSGIFAVEANIIANVVIEVQSQQLYRMRLLQDGTDGTMMRLKVQPCRLLLPSVEGVAELEIPPETELVIQTKVLDQMGAFLSMADPVGANFAPPPARILVGADLASPDTDPLPTMMDPSTQIDEDGDGNPGVTVRARTVLCRNPEDAYVALRASAMLDGTVEDLDTITGDVTPVLDFSVLGFSDPCLAASAEIEINVQPGSTFRAVRVGDEEDLDGNGNVSCPELAWRASTLFGDHWAY